MTLAAALSGLAPRTAHATPELDRRYALDTVGYLRSWDNMDGLFVDYVADAYRDYFSRQSRFTVQDLGKADTVLSRSKIPYKKLIEDREILVEVARTSHSQTLIRTEVTKEGAQYRFSIEWLLAPSMEIISSGALTLTDPRDGSTFAMQDLKNKLEKTLDEMISAVPFAGNVSGRDKNTVTINLGSEAQIEPGDTLQVSTLDGVKRHPLLNQIVEWQLTKTGKIMIDQVEDKISFGHVISEEPGQQITPKQKITAISKKAVVSANETAPTETKEKGTTAAALYAPPAFGWVAGNLYMGGFSRDYSSLDNTINTSGGGFLFGVSAQGQLWFTRNWFADFSLGYGFYNYSQNSASLGTSGWTNFVLDGGYSYLINDDVMGPKAWVKLGYRSNSYSLPDSSANNIAAISFKSLFLGLGGDVPIQDGWGATADLGIGLFKGESEDSNFSGNATSVSDVSFTLGGYYRYTPRITFRAMLDMQFNGADFDSQRTLSQKVITFSPALVYYF
ncbi:MAG: hypothetical protein P4M08_02770 [Oligoflexia bacterium]|nr:hypothetical protein [Oligoflexia bacterium]